MEDAAGDDLLVVIEHLLEQSIRLCRWEEADAGWRPDCVYVRVGTPDVIRQVVLERQTEALAKVREAGLVTDARCGETPRLFSAWTLASTLPTASATSIARRAWAMPVAKSGMSIRT